LRDVAAQLERLTRQLATSDAHREQVGCLETVVYFLYVFFLFIWHCIVSLQLDVDLASARGDAEREVLMGTDEQQRLRRRIQALVRSNSVCP
jgi:hypothetical protein